MSVECKKMKSIRKCLGRVEECILTTLHTLPEGIYIGDIIHKVNNKLANLNIVVSDAAFYKAISALDKKGLIETHKVSVNKHNKTRCKITDLGIGALRELYYIYTFFWHERQ